MDSCVPGGGCLPELERGRAVYHTGGLFWDSCSPFIPGCLGCMLGIWCANKRGLEDVVGGACKEGCAACDAGDADRQEHHDQ